MLREIQETDNKSFSPILGVNKVGWSPAGVLPFPPTCCRLWLGFSINHSKIQGFQQLRKEEFLYCETFKLHMLHFSYS